MGETTSKRNLEFEVIDLVDIRDFREDKITDQNELIGQDDGSYAPDKLFKRLIKNYREYCQVDESSKIKKAYNLAKKAHKGQKRKSGDEYIVHPVSVAVILSELEMDTDSIIAGLLHDVVEDTGVSLDEIKKDFGDDVALLVDGVTKLNKVHWEGGKEERQAENLRKMFLAMSEDIRVVIIKLADRTHNMRTIQFMTPEKQKEKAKETLEIFCPLADRLGISRIKIELDNLALAYLEPEDYKNLVEEIDSKKGAREEYIKAIVDEVESKIRQAGIMCEAYGRVKHYFSIYKKMKRQNKTLDEIYDIFAVRILVDDVPNCYAALGVIHELYTPIPGRFKDYIAMPKPNSYQSLHTTLIGRDGIPFEIQIRTKEMHKIAEYGIAAHWSYKEGGASSANDLDKFAWLRQILEWQKEMPDDEEFLSSVKNDLNVFDTNVYCFTPGGDLKAILQGSSTIDFAYLIHTAVGNKMIGARVNGKLVNIDYILKNGDRVEIITSQNSKGPSRDWLKHCKTPGARNKINQWFRAQNKEENIEKGHDLLESYCKSEGIELSEITKTEYVDKVVARYGFKKFDQILAAVGHGGLKEGQVVNKLVEEKKRHEKKVVNDEAVIAAIKDNKKVSRKSSNGIIIEGIEDMSVHMARCCNPIPGDEIVGFVTRGRGISIHRTDCANLLSLPEIERGRMISAEWDVEEGGKESFVVQISIYSNDRKGLLADVSRILTEEDILILALRTATNKQSVSTIVVDFEISGQEELSRLISKIKQIDSIIDVERTIG